MTFTLHEMVQRIHAEVDQRVKLASTAEGCKESEAESEEEQEVASTTDNAATKPERNEEPIGSTKTSSAFVLKLASAVEYCNGTFIKQAEAVENTLNTVVSGTQNYETGQATPKNVIPMSPKVVGQNSLETDKDIAPGGKEDWSDKDVLRAKVARVLKIAEDALSPASISAGPAVGPDSSASGEGVPAQGGDTSQKRMIMSNAAATDYTKRDAKAVPKERMGEVLTEPAQKKSTDPVLYNNLSKTEEAGVKISSVKVAAARALLRKIAQQGSCEDASPEDKERAAKLQAALNTKEKASAGMGESGGSAAAGMGNGAQMPVGGGF